MCYTGSGSTGLRVSRERPDTPVIALTPIAATARRLALAWGLHCVLTDDAHDLDDMVARACLIAFTEGFAEAGQRIIITAGVPLGTPGATNMLRIAYVGKEGRPGIRSLSREPYSVSRTMLLPPPPSPAGTGTELAP